jgi:hypothetical protein
MWNEDSHATKEGSKIEKEFAQPLIAWLFPKLEGLYI